MDCEPEETIEQTLDSLIKRGFVDVHGVTEDGELTYALTEAGVRYVEDELIPSIRVM
jgi:DNA-binding PadR family transcriptional regulator